MGGLYSHTTRATGLVLTAAIYNADHQNHIDNLIPSMIDDMSANAAAYQTTTNPGGVGTESLPTSLAGELERLRYVIKTMHGGAQWYPGSVLASLGAQTFTGTQRFSKGADIASANPLVIGTDGNYFNVTGAVGFASMTVAAGTWFMLDFNGACAMTDGASLDLGGTSITTAANDRAIFYATAANTVKLMAYYQAVGSPQPPDQTEAEAGSATVPRPWTAQRIGQSIAALSKPGLTLISTVSPSAVASVDITGLSSTYEAYLIVGHLIPATDDVQLWLRLDSNGGASFDAGGSDYSHAGQQRTGTTAATSGSAGDTKIQVTCDGGAGFAIGNGVTEGVNFEIIITRHSNAAVWTFVDARGCAVDAAGSAGYFATAGARLAAQADDAVQLLFESGNIASGVVKLYGLRKTV